MPVCLRQSSLQGDSHTVALKHSDQDLILLSFSRRRLKIVMYKSVLFCYFGGIQRHSPVNSEQNKELQSLHDSSYTLWSDSNFYGPAPEYKVQQG